MDELATRCQNQLASFRITELKHVLSRLGLSKQGKKQILMDKIMEVLVPAETTPSKIKGSKMSKNAVSREEAANVIDDIYRKLRSIGAPDLGLAGRSRVVAGVSGSMAQSDEQEEVVGWDEAKTRCPCGNSVDKGTMIQCDDSKCGVWQHLNCVLPSEKPSEGGEPEIPSSFYCELCRIARCDPFCVSLSHPLLPTKPTVSVSKVEGSNPLQNVEKTFTLSHADWELLHKPNYDLQVWCVLLTDKVPFRMHWPAYCGLRINSASVRVTNRPGQQLLGTNGRDDGPGITTSTREGLNQLLLSAYDARDFCIGVRIIHRNSLKQVMDLIPAVTKGEAFEDALLRLRRSINGGGGAGGGVDDDDDDSDLEVITESITVTLRCPMSGSRIKVAGRFKPCLHMGCFDLNTFVELNQRARKWQCPICLKNYSIESLIIDPLFNCITSAMKHMGEDITEVEMKDDGSWRPKLEGEARLQEPWRTPQGSFVIAANGSNHHKPVSWQPPLMPVKVEEGLSSHEQASLKLGMKRMHDGVWAINGFKHPNGWADAGPSKRLKPVANISRSTDVNEEQEDGDRSVNQEASEKAAVYSDDGDEVAFPVKMGDASTGMWQSTGGDVENGDTDVIVLSDTDEEEAGEDTVLGSSGAPVYMGSDGLGHGTTQSPNIAAEDLHDLHDLHAESPGLALAPDRETGLALSSGSLHFKHLPDRRMDSFTNNEEGLGLQLENSNFWSSQMRNISSGPFGYYGGSDPPSISHHPLPTRPTPVQVAAGMGFALPSPPPHREDSIRGSSWRRYSQPSHSLPYASAEHNGGGSSDSGRGASPSESALYLFLPPQPARVPVQSNSQEALMAEEEEVDNTWFSLSLGGGRNGIDSALPSHIPSSPSQEVYGPPLKARGGLDTISSTGAVLFGMSGTGTAQARLFNSQGSGHSRSMFVRNTIPARPRSSPPDRRYHQFRVADSDSE
ncbi:unnamed protein product [Sphagnum jensenii]|uniref:E3 SUMO-protein ligase SIZ1 n=1 Tax=Sphagnum jensenii TaxID=128206 RepID=A0ABP0WX98_9BRYO